MNPPSSPPARWEKLGSALSASCRVFDVRTVRFRHPMRAVERDFTVIQAPDWVNVLALTPDHRLVLVRQFRWGTDEFSLETPGGVIDAGEDPVAAGRRELREETGGVGGSARLLASVHPNPAIQNNRCHLVLIENVTLTGGTNWDHDEEIEVLTAPVDEVYAWARAGRITHALVLNALLFFAPEWERLRQG